MEITLDTSKFEADLKRLNFSDRKPALVKALLSAVGPTVQLASQLAPVDTGLLARNIASAEDKKNKDPDLVSVLFGQTSKAFYGFFQEFRNRSHRD